MILLLLDIKLFWMESQNQTIDTIIASSTDDSQTAATPTSTSTQNVEHLSPLTIPSEQGPPSAWSPYPSPTSNEFTANLTSGTQPCTPIELPQLNPDELLLEEPSESGEFINTNPGMHDPNTESVITSIFNTEVQHYNEAMNSNLVNPFLITNPSTNST